MKDVTVNEFIITFDLLLTVGVFGYATLIFNDESGMKHLWCVMMKLDSAGARLICKDVSPSRETFKVRHHCLNTVSR